MNPTNLTQESFLSVLLIIPKKTGQKQIQQNVLDYLRHSYKKKNILNTSETEKTKTYLRMNDKICQR
jgi:hypothetical protein